MLDLMVIVNLCGDTYKVAMILGSKSRYISDTSSVTMDLYESLNWLDYRTDLNNSFSSKHFLEDNKHPAHLNP